MEFNTQFSHNRMSYLLPPHIIIRQVKYTTLYLKKRTLKTTQNTLIYCYSHMFYAFILSHSQYLNTYVCTIVVQYRDCQNLNTSKLILISDSKGVLSLRCILWYLVFFRMVGGFVDSLSAVLARYSTIDKIVLQFLGQLILLLLIDVYWGGTSKLVAYI